MNAKHTFAICAFALAASFSAAPAAVAWDKVCVRLPLGKAWLVPQLHIISHFPAWDTRRNVQLDHLPGVANGETHVNHEAGSRYDYDLPDGLGGDRGVRASGPFMETGGILAGQSKCLDISGFPDGTAFFAYVSTAFASALCETHSSNRFRYYLQTDRPYREMWYEAWGAEWSPNCEFTHEK